MSPFTPFVSGEVSVKTAIPSHVRYASGFSVVVVSYVAFLWRPHRLRQQGRTVGLSHGCTSLCSPGAGQSPPGKPRGVSQTRGGLQGSCPTLPRLVASPCISTWSSFSTKCFFLVSFSLYVELTCQTELSVAPLTLGPPWGALPVSRRGGRYPQHKNNSTSCVPAETQTRSQRPEVDAVVIPIQG